MLGTALDAFLVLSDLTLLTSIFPVLQTRKPKIRR